VYNRTTCQGKCWILLEEGKKVEEKTVIPNMKTCSSEKCRNPLPTLATVRLNGGFQKKRLFAPKPKPRGGKANKINGEIRGATFSGQAFSPWGKSPVNRYQNLHQSGRGVGVPARWVLLLIFRPTTKARHDRKYMEQPGLRRGLRRTAFASHLRRDVLVTLLSNKRREAKTEGRREMCEERKDRVWEQAKNKISNCRSRDYEK